MTREEYLRYGLETELLKFSEYLELTKPLNLPEGLEEAADNYAHTLGCDEYEYESVIAAAKEDFIAGAKWDRAKMMERAVEGRVFMSFAPGHNQMVMADVDLPTNTKVRVIVIPEESEKVK